MLGGVKEMRGWAPSIYVQAWEISSELQTTIRSVDRIRLGVSRFRRAAWDESCRLYAIEHPSEKSYSEQLEDVWNAAEPTEQHPTVIHSESHDI